MEWQNVCAMLEVVGVADLKCEDVQDLPAPLRAHVAKYAKLLVEQVRL